MHRPHRIWILLLCALLLAGLFACKRKDVADGGSGETTQFDFSNVENDKIPDGWWINSYRDGYRLISEDGAFGFDTNGPNDCRLCRTVEVKAETTYVLYADVRTENVNGGQGATLSLDNYSLDGCFIYSEPLYGTNDWTQVALAFRTAEGQEAVTLALRVGGYSSDSSGTALFRNVRLVETDRAPVAVQVLHPSNDDYGDEDEGATRTKEDYENMFTVIFWAGAIAAIVLAFGFLYRGKALSAVRNTSKSKYWIFPVIVVIGLLVRYLLCAKYQGHASDMKCWPGWGKRIWETGTHGFYVGNGFCDYPPGYMIVCGILFRISTAFESAPETLRLFIYMLPAFCCDVLSGLLILTNAKRFRLPDSLALLLAGLIVLNPAAVFLSGAWGQIDSILTVMLIGTFLLLNASRKRPYLRVVAAILYALAIMTKWQALIFGPVLALMYVATGCWTWNRESFLKHLLWSIAAVAAAFVVLLFFTLLFRGDNMEFLWMIERYKNASSGYDYASVEGYNFITFFGGNWAPVFGSGTRTALPIRAMYDLPMFANMTLGQIFLKCSELFSRIALLVGFPTLIFRAWNRMRTRKEKELNTAFFELLFAGILTVLLALLRFTAVNYAAKNAGTQALLKAIWDFPLYGVMMLGMFTFIVYRECRGRRFIDWIKDGGTTVAGTVTLALAFVVFFGTWLLSAICKLFGSELTWIAFGTIGIVTAGLIACGLFAIYLVKHIKAKKPLYSNRGLIFLLAACFMVWTFTFGHYMHERYIFPALFLLAFAYAYDRDPHKLAAFCMLSVTTFMNEAVAMYVVSDGAIYMIRGGELHNRMIDLISFFEVGAALYLIATSFRSALVFNPRDPAGDGMPEEPEEADGPAAEEAFADPAEELPFADGLTEAAAEEELASPAEDLLISDELLRAADEPETADGGAQNGL